MRNALLAGLAVATGLCTTSAVAQTWPVRALKIISPFPAGGPTDTMARPVAEHLAKVLGQPVIIESRPGAGSTIGASFVAKSDPDGYTFLFGTNSGFSIGPALYAKAGYTAASFAPIVLVAEAPMVLCVSNKSGVKTVAELVAAVRKSPEEFSFASVGVATSLHLLGERFNQTAGLKMAHVPYRGSAPAMNDLVGGQVQVFFDVASSALPQAEANNIRVLMVLDKQRAPKLPDVPTSQEAGFPEFLGTFWGGLAAPVGTPQAIVEQLNREINAFIKTPEYTRLMTNLTFSTVGGTAKEFGDRMVSEAAIWKAVGDKAGIRVD